MKAEALRYASLGYPVFPVKVGMKDPATSHGFKDATTDIDQIESWWSENPKYNIGIANGHGLDVIDLDGQKGLESWKAWARQHRFHWIYRHRIKTPNGYHIYVKSQGMKRHTNVLPGVDYLGLGGYSIAPPSYSMGQVKNGKLKPGGCYTVHHEGVIEEADLEKLVNPHKKCDRVSPAAPVAPSPFTTNYGFACLVDACRNVREAALGDRNNRFYFACRGIFQLVAGGEVNELIARSALVEAASLVGLEEIEIERTLESAKLWGFDHPRKAN